MRNRQGEEKPAAFAGGAFHPDPTLMQFDKIFGNRQAEPRPSVLDRYRFAAVEPFEDPRQFPRPDPAARIADANLNVSWWSYSPLDQNRSPSRRELDGVLNQVVQDLEELVAISLNERQARCRMSFHAHGFLCGDGLEPLDHVVKQLRNRDGARLQLHGTGLDAGEIQEIIDHAREPFDIVLNPLQIIGG